MIQLLQKDGSWDAFRADWEAQCREVGEDASEYAVTSIEILHGLAVTESRDSWAVGLFEDQRCLAVAMANCANIPGPPGKTLRVRHVIVCPLLDYGVLSESAYADALIELTLGIIQLSESSLRSQRIKFHLRSPGDMDYFRAFGRSLDKTGVFASCVMRGAWLYVDKT